MRRMLVPLVWLLVHLYVGWRLLPDLPGTAAALALGAGLVLSTVLAPAALWGRRARTRSAADRWSWAGMLVLGLFSMLLVLTLLRDAVLLLSWPFVQGAWREVTAAAVPLLALLAGLVGFAAARRTAAVRDVELRIDGLPAALAGFTLVQISDVHVGPTVSGRTCRPSSMPSTASGPTRWPSLATWSTAASPTCCTMWRRWPVCARATAVSLSPATTSTTAARWNGRLRCAVSVCGC